MDGVRAVESAQDSSEEASVRRQAPVVTLTLFTYKGFTRKAWIFLQMGLAHRDMRPSYGPQPLFYKLVGSGSGIGFDPKPNWARYGVLATWSNEDAARDALVNHPVLTRWKARAEATETFLLRPTRSSGRWSGVDPFPVPESRPETRSESGGQVTEDETRGPIGVITRARLRVGILGQFWRRVPDISKQIDGADGLIFKVGIGEVPWLHQITFSLWRDARAIRDFAYKGSGAHAAAIEDAHRGGWFEEDLFARFSLIDHIKA